ncbi:MAG: sigma-70 family RNA polymerase sigma factor [Clostridia bacterium]|nr:sigma-70 family RNA polymerase sigma factor [Clostridia bacterium]
MDKKEIHSIFEKIKKGEKQATEELYKKYQKLVINIAFIIVKDSFKAEEISQIVFLKIMQMPKEKLPESNELSWIYTVTKHQTIDYLRKQNDEIDIDTLYDIQNNKNEIDEIIDIDTYQKTIECLETKEQEIVSLKILCNFTFKEIGLILNMPTATVQWRYYKSVHTLKILVSNLSLFIITTLLYLKASNENIHNNEIQNEGQSYDDEKQNENNSTEPYTNLSTKNNSEQKNTNSSSLKVSDLAGESLESKNNTIQDTQIIEGITDIKEPVLIGLSSIFLIISIIFAIIFAKHQQKRKLKSSK